MERFIVAFSIFLVAFAIAYAAGMAVTAKPPPPVARPHVKMDPARRLEKLEARLAEAQKSIDEVLLKLATTNVDSERDATRVRLDVLYRLEDGLLADIREAHAELQSRATGRVDGAWELREKPSP